MKFKHLLFDLDHTLWDYDRNASETLIEIYESHNLDQFTSIKKDEFVMGFLSSNAKYWKLFNHGLIDKEELRVGRFLSLIGNSDTDSIAIAIKIAEDFSNQCPIKSHLMPNTLSLLQKSQAMGYQLHVLTNGFKDSQIQKMNSSGISHFFASITTSECSGYRKPSKEFFEIALSRANALPIEALMIGDNQETDIAGALDAGIKAVWYNPNQIRGQEFITHEISDLLDLLKILQE